MEKQLQLQMLASPHHPPPRQKLLQHTLASGTKAHWCTEMDEPFQMGTRYIPVKLLVFSYSWVTVFQIFPH